MRSLMQFNCHPYKKGEFGHRNRHAQKEDNVRTHRLQMAK